MRADEPDRDFDEFDDVPFDEYDEFEDAMADCGMMPDGLCMKAGSEECDFECPVMDLIRREARGEP